MEDLISIIVPVYNSEKYVDGCIKSVLLQTYINFELLLIDDGSQDNTRKICKELCDVDKRIRLICKEHRGVSVARNIGLKEAKGKFLFFLDSDDVIHPRLLETLYELLEKTQTIMAAVTHYCAGEGSFQNPPGWETDVYKEPRSICLSSERAIDYLIYGNQEAMLYIMGGKLIRHEAVRTIKFSEKLTNGEDTLFLYQLLANGVTVSVLCQNWYYYRKRKAGTSRIYSVDTCQSRYLSYKYIIDCEILNGRMRNAVHLEKAALEAMINWYDIGRNKRDIRLIKYVRRLINKEKRLEIFLQVGCIKKIEIYLTLYCYPLYRIACLLYSWLMRFPRFERIVWLIRLKLRREGM